jgi:hypothetical protein
MYIKVGICMVFGNPNTPPELPPEPNPTGSASDNAAQMQMKQFLAFLEQHDKDKAQTLSLAEKNLLANTTISSGSQNSSSHDVYENGRKVATINSHGGVDPGLIENPQTAKDYAYNVEAVMKGCLIFKANTGTEVELHGKNELQNQMGAKAAELLGMHVDNPPKDSLDKTNPELARQMEQWARDHGIDVKKAENFDNTAKSVLVTAPSPLDNIQKGSLSTAFSPAAIGVANIATPAVMPTPSIKRDGPNLA